MLSSVPYDIHRFTLGNNKECRWMPKDSRILSMDTVYIDGVQYSRADGARLERTSTERYPLAHWGIDLVETGNPMSDDLFVYFPKANPLMMRYANSATEQYYKDGLPGFEVSDFEFSQKFQTLDRIRIQFIADMTRVRPKTAVITLNSCQTNQVVRTFSLDYVTAQPGTLLSYNYTYSAIPGSISDGEYYVKMTIQSASIGGDVLTYYSERLDIREEHENTIRLEYSNSRNSFDMLFSNDNISNPCLYKFYLRVDGGFKSDGLAVLSEDNYSEITTSGHPCSVPCRITPCGLHSETIKAYQTGWRGRLTGRWQWIT
jgi:hypothetical protein